MRDRPLAVLVTSALALGFLALWSTSQITKDTDSRYPRSATLLRGYAAQFHTTLTSLDDTVPAGSDTPDVTWLAHISAVDEALEKRDVDAAVRAWHHAYGAAFAARAWEAMLAVGDAMVRIEEVARTPRGSKPNARRAYLIGLIRARRQGSVEGAVRVAEAFWTLGDTPVARQCLVIAERLAAERADPSGAERVREAAARFGARLVELQTPAEF